MERELRRSRVAAELRAEIGRQKVTRTAVASAAGISEDTLRRRLDGEKPFYLDELDAIVRFLGANLPEFIKKTEVER